MLRFIGAVTAIALAGAAVYGARLLIDSLPDIARYQRIRSM